MNGWCHFADKRPSPNYTKGHDGRKAVALHIAEGGYISSRNWLCNPKSKVSSHFIVSQRGHITQMVSIHDTAFTNGLTPLDDGCWLTPSEKLIVPRWPLITPGVNPNRQTVTIEHEGWYQQPWTAAMEAATSKLLRWIAGETNLVYVPHQTLIGHCDINHLDKCNCPGPHVDYQRLADLAQGQRFVVRGDGTRVRQRPTTASAILAMLQRGDDVIGTVVNGDGGQWIKRSTVGYVRRDLLDVA